MKTIRIVFLLILMMVCPAPAQTFNMELSEAEDLFQKKIYAEAIQFYENRITQKNANGNMYYKAGICYLQSRSQQEKAIPCFEKAIELSTSFYSHGLAKESDAPMDVYLLLGEAYRQLFFPEKAIKAFQDYREKLLNTKPTNLAVLQQVEDKIEATTYEAALKMHYEVPTNFKFPAFIRNEQNEAGEFNATMSPDKNTMIYTIKIPINKIAKNNDALYFDDTFIIKPRQEERKTDPKKIPEILPDTLVNISTLGTSIDGQAMLTYKNDAGYCNLYLQRLLANEWSRARRLPRTSNTGGWEPGEYQTADGKNLYFISDRPGGYGGYDIYACTRLENGKWSKAFNLGSTINTEFNEVAPFPFPDGKGLCFSSNRLHPKTGFDIYVAEQTDNAFQKLKLTGYPITSTEDNLYYQVATDKKKLLSEVRTETQKKTGADAKHVIKDLSDSLQSPAIRWRNNYLLTFESPDAPALTILKTLINKENKSGPDKPVDFLLIDLSTGKILQRLYCDQKEGLQLLIPANITCGLSSKSSSFISDSYLINGSPQERHLEKFGPINIYPVREGTLWEIQTIQFEEKTEQFKKISAVELDRLYKLLQNYPDSKIRFLYTLSSGDAEYKELAKKRVLKIKDHLVERGISGKRIKCKHYFRKEVAPVKLVDGKKEIKLRQELKAELIKLN